MSNLEFLKTEWHELYEIAKEAESCIYSKPIYTCILNRNALENAVLWMYKYDSDLKEPYDTQLSSLVTEPSFVRIFANEPQIIQKIHVIRKAGNLAAHDSRKITQNDALYSTAELFHFLYWFAYSYSEKEITKGLTFEQYFIPKEENSADKIKELEKQIEEYKLSEIKREDLEKENQELLAQIQEIKEKNKEISLSLYISSITQSYQTNEAITTT